MKRVNICGVSIDNVTMEEAICCIQQLILKRSPSVVVTPNVDHIMKLQSDESFQQIYRDADLVLADGLPLLWAAKFLGTPLKAKVSGSDLFPRLCEFSSNKHYRLFFLGGRAGAALKAADILQKRYTGIDEINVYSPPHGFEHDMEENSKIVQMVQNSQSDILFVGLGAPKQEEWIKQYILQCEVSVAIGVGVSFEFVAGMVKRAPVWMQNTGLEWFWRLIMEPRRLWKRYLIDDMQFFLVNF